MDWICKHCVWSAARLQGDIESEAVDLQTIAWISLIENCQPACASPSCCTQRAVESSKRSPYARDLDFLSPSVWHKGRKPLSPDSILEKSIRPALAKEGIVAKRIGWHSFRHSLATNLRSLGVDIKVAQMRHSSYRTTLDIYTRAVDHQKREASLKIIELILPREMGKFRHPSAPSAQLSATSWNS